MSVKITDLGPISLPLTGTEQLEIVDSNGLSRRVSSAALGSPAGLLATFVTVTANLDLPNERVLTAGAGISIVDGGAGMPITISAAAAGGQVDSIVGGLNVSVNAADPINPIVNLDAAITGVSVNGVTLSDAGVATDFLDETGAYSTPPEFDPTAAATIFGQWQFNLPIRLRYTAAVGNSPGVGQVHASGDDIFFVDANGVSTSLLGGGGGGGSPFTTPLDISTVFNIPIGGLQDALLRYQRLDATPLAHIGFDGGDQDFEIACLNNGGRVQIFANNSVAAQVTGFSFDPDSGTSVRGVASVSLQVGFETAFFAQPNSFAEMRFDNIATIRTATAATGGAVVNNTLTGGGLERVLTVSDLAGDILFGAPGDPASIYLNERTSAGVDIAGRGQLWVRDRAPNQLWFTDDTGIDYPVATARVRRVSNQSYDMNTAGNAEDLTNGQMFFDDGVDYTITLEDSADTEFEVDQTFQIINADSGTITLAEGAGDTLLVLDGAAGTVTDATGSATLGTGAVATVQRVAAGTWLVWGSGITP